ncbi:MAG: phenylacetate-CoA oxygenase subunit PaaC [Bacteroidia bacterium]|nr:phenylacetate-CoA oxygenase subunit PaaC [Bacteroidia bacterium]
MTTQQALFGYCLRLGDDSLILAQRLAEWTGHGPFLEEDLALTNISLDLFGRANALLMYAGRLEGKGRDGDRLAFHRGEREYFNSLMAEQPKGDYAFTILRLSVMSSYQFHLYTALASSKDETLAGIAAKSVKEITYHVRHAHSWVRRFAGGTEESSRRLHTALHELWRFTDDLFETNAQDCSLVDSGIAADTEKVKTAWSRDMDELFGECGLQLPRIPYMQSGSRDGKHSEHLGFLLAEMQFLPRAYPDAKW